MLVAAINIVVIMIGTRSQLNMPATNGCAQTSRRAMRRCRWGASLGR